MIRLFAYGFAASTVVIEVDCPQGIFRRRGSFEETAIDRSEIKVASLGLSAS